MENQVKFLSLGCRLNTVEAEKIKAMLADAGAGRVIVVNTCSVTAEAERQSRQAIRKLSRENPGIPLFVTGCAATRAPEDYAKIPGVAAVVSNKDKMKLEAYKLEVAGSRAQSAGKDSSKLSPALCDLRSATLSKAFVQIQNGCNHSCAYCIVSKLRGKSVSFPYERILVEVRAAVDAGFYEVVLTGVDIAGYRIVPYSKGGLSDLCKRLLADVPGLQRLRLSSVDPASPEVSKIMDLMSCESRMLPHLHLSMQSGSDKILAAMGRRHNVQMVRELVRHANNKFSSSLIPHPSSLTFSWDIICGFPGETPELFAETCELIKESGPIRIHAFPFSPRPGTAAATMPNQVDKAEAKRRVGTVGELARENRRRFMRAQIGKTVQVLMEGNNVGRTPDDIAVKAAGAAIEPGTILNLKLIGSDGEYMLA